ncbi:MAG: GntR family transcriptional regulator [Synergistales bacterium]|nr:GntR family transcriptional regulator [Synergistales bacterium]
MKSALEQLRPREVAPLREDIYKVLREAIFRGELEAGDHLVETELAERMGVSRTPVREALRRLEAEALVEHVPRKGVVVAGVTEDTIIEVYSIREALETLAITFSKDQATEKELARLDELVEEARRHSHDGEDDALFDAMRSFSELLVETCKRPRLIRLVHTYHNYLQPLRSRGLRNHERRDVAIDEHAEMVEALRRKDEEWAVEVVRRHLRGARQACLRSFREERERRG